MGFFLGAYERFAKIIFFLILVAVLFLELLEIS
jgi:hypothetical protein